MTGLEYILKLKDQFSPQMVKAAGIADSAAMRIQRNMNNAAGSAKSFKYSLNDLKQKLDQINATRLNTHNADVFKAATLEAKKLEQQIQKLEGKSSGGTAVSAIGRRLAVAASLTGIMAFAGNSVKAAMDFGSTKKSFEVLTGSRQKGAGLANELNTLQQNTILGPEVFRAAQTMMSFGVATEDVVKRQRQLGDISMGNRDKFEALTLAFSQTTAAERLMGQDLLQYINAGFNPLQVMNERWQEFGFKQKQSVGQLRKLMEDGLISSSMVAKSFDLATSKGGKFANMMDAMAETSGGRLQILQGQFENFKIQVGNALMPVADSLMNMGNRLLEVLNISKTAPQILMQERGEIAALMKVITGLNEGNDLRSRLLSQLVTKYPDLFKNIDTEKITNGELLRILNDVNAAYDRRIGLATSDLIISNASKDLKEAQADYTKYMTLIELNKRGEHGAERNLRSWSDAFNANKPGYSAMEVYQKGANEAKAKLDEANRLLDKEKSIKKNRSTINKLEEIDELTRNPNKAKEVFGELWDKKGNMMGNYKKFRELSNGIYKDNSGQWHYYSEHQLSQLQSLMNPITANATAMPGGGDKSGSKGVGQAKAMADSINSGGQRTITNIINIQKQVGAENIHVMNGKEAANEIESLVREAMRRMLLSLNGGAVA